MADPYDPMLSGDIYAPGVDPWTDYSHWAAIPEDAQRLYERMKALVMTPEGRASVADYGSRITAKDLVKGASDFPYQVLGLPADLAGLALDLGSFALPRSGYEYMHRNLKKPIGGSESLRDVSEYLGIAQPRTHTPGEQVGSALSGLGAPFMAGPMASNLAGRSAGALSRLSEPRGVSADEFAQLVREARGRGLSSPEEIEAFVQRVREGTADRGATPEGPQWGVDMQRRLEGPQLALPAPTEPGPFAPPSAPRGPAPRDLPPGSWPPEIPRGGPPERADPLADLVRLGEELQGGQPTTQRGPQRQPEAGPSPSMATQFAEPPMRTFELAPPELAPPGELDPTQLRFPRGEVPEAGALMPGPKEQPWAPSKVDRTRPDIKGALSRPRVPGMPFIRDEEGFTSKAVEILADAKSKKETPAGWARYLANKGVSPYEMRWSGFYDTYDVNDKKAVPKEEVMEHFWNAMPTLRQTRMYGEDQGHRAGVYRDMTSPRDEQGRQMYVVRDNANDRILDRGYDSRELEQNLKNNAYPGYGEFADYESLTAPGGSDYQTHVLSYDQPKPSGYGVGYYDHQTGEQVVLGNFPTEAAAIDARRDDALLRQTADQPNRLAPSGDIVGLDVKGQPIPKAVRNAHFQTQAGVNPIFHRRLKTRIGPNGERVLHATELQADWSQAYGQNFRHALGERAKVAGEGEARAFELGRPLTPEESETFQRTEAFRRQPKLPDEPHLPHIADTNRVIEMNLKHTLMDAVDRGFDKVVLGPGQENAFNSGLGQVFTTLVYDPDNESLMLSNPVEGAVVSTHASLQPRHQQDEMIRTLGKGLADKVRRKVAATAKQPDMRPVFTIRNDPNDTRPIYKVMPEPEDPRPEYNIVTDEDDPRPVYTIDEESGEPDDSQLARVDEEEGEIDPDRYASTDSYEEEEDADNIPVDEEGNPEREPETVTLWRAVDPDGDVIEEGFETEREAERAAESYNDNLEADTYFVVYDGDGDEIARYSVNEEGRTRARRYAQTAASDHNSEITGPSQFHVEDAGGERVESFGDYDEALEKIKELGGREKYSARYLAKGPDDAVLGPFETAQAARSAVEELGGRHDWSDTRYIAQGPEGPPEGPFDSEYTARQHVETIGGKGHWMNQRMIAEGPDGQIEGPFESASAAQRHVRNNGGRLSTEAPRPPKMSRVEMGPDEVVPQGKEFAVTGSGYHKTYDATVLNIANDLVKKFKAKFKKHAFKMPARRGGSGLWEALNQNRMTLEEFGKLPVEEKQRLLEEGQKSHMGHELDITPELARAIKNKGFDRYKEGGQVMGAVRHFAMGGYGSEDRFGGSEEGILQPEYNSPPHFDFQTPPPGSLDIVPGTGGGPFENLPGDSGLDRFIQDRERPRPIEPPPLKSMTPQQSGSSGGGGGDMGQMIKLGMQILPFLLAEGGQVGRMRANPFSMPDPNFKALEDPEGQGELDRLLAIIDMLPAQRKFDAGRGDSSRRVEDILWGNKIGWPEEQRPSYADGGVVDVDWQGEPGISMFDEGGAVCPPGGTQQPESPWWRAQPRQIAPPPSTQPPPTPVSDWSPPPQWPWQAPQQQQPEQPRQLSPWETQGPTPPGTSGLMATDWSGPQTGGPMPGWNPQQTMSPWMQLFSGMFNGGYAKGGQVDDDMLNYGVMFYDEGGKVERDDGGTAHDIGGMLGQLAGMLIPIPVLGPMIGRFAGHTLGNVIEGNTDEIGDDAQRDFTFGMADPDSEGGFNEGAVGPAAGSAGMAAMPYMARGGALRAYR